MWAAPFKSARRASGVALPRCSRAPLITKQFPAAICNSGYVMRSRGHQYLFWSCALALVGSTPARGRLARMKLLTLRRVGYSCGGRRRRGRFFYRAPPGAPRSLPIGPKGRHAGSALSRVLFRRGSHARRFEVETLWMCCAGRRSQGENRRLRVFDCRRQSEPRVSDARHDDDGGFGVVGLADGMGAARTWRRRSSVST